MMSLFRQIVHTGLIVSSLLLCTLLLYSYQTYLKLPSVPKHSGFLVRGSNTLDKKLSNSQTWLNIAEVKFRDPTRNQNNTAISNGLSSVSNGLWGISSGISENSHCVPRKNIVFFKMHKCSSSTVQNVLFRYGEEHQLNFVLPSRGNYLGNMNSVFNKKVMMQFPVKKYNVLCHHTRFSYRGMREVMESDVVYTTILRDPVAMYESLFTYLDMAGLYNLPKHKALDMFLEEPDYYYDVAHGGKCKARNPMLFDLGLQEAALGDRISINKKIKELTKQFDLVLITEYFEESLILLRHLMCWDMEDIVYFVLNARNKSSVMPVSPKMADKIRKWNFGDVKLYNIFNHTLWRKVEAFGHDRMKKEVGRLRERNEYFKEHCIAEVVSQDMEVWRPPGINVDSFHLKPEALEDKRCVQMARTELPYSDLIRDIQIERFWK